MKTDGVRHLFLHCLATAIEVSQRLSDLEIRLSLNQVTRFAYGPPLSIPVQYCSSHPTLAFLQLII
jgi:hypothetical protein